MLFWRRRRRQRSASHEREREARSRAGRVGTLAAHCATRLPESALRAALAFVAFWHQEVFCLLLRGTALVLQPASRGVAVGCLVWVFASFGRASRFFIRAARVKSALPGPNADFRVLRLNDLETQFLALSAFPELADVGRRSKSICGRTH